MKKIIYIFIIFQVLYSCKSFYVVSDINKSIDFSQYNLYVFKMCQNPDFKIKNTSQPELYAYPKYSNCTYDDLKNNTNLKSIEETYLYMPKPDYSNNPVVYITTFSHKYTYKNYGVFNCQAFKNKIFIEDIDYVYLGKKVGDNQIEFYKNSPKKRKQFISKWNYTYLDTNTLQINDVTLTDSTIKEKPQVNLDSTFSLKALFKKDIRVIEYGKNNPEYLWECYFKGNLKKPPTSKGKNIGGKVNNLYVDKNGFYFTSKSKNDKTKEYYKFKKKRMPFSYKFPN